MRAIAGAPGEYRQHWFREAHPTRGWRPMFQRQCRIVINFPVCARGRAVMAARIRAATAHRLVRHTFCLRLLLENAMICPRVGWLRRFHQKPKVRQSSRGTSCTKELVSVTPASERTAINGHLAEAVSSNRS